MYAAVLPFADAASDWMDAHPVLFPLLIVAGFCIVFPLFWCVVVWLISLFGWARLARHYAVARPPAGEAQPVMCGMVSASTYRGVMRFQPDAGGFYLWTSVFFRAGHPPLYIPWSDATAAPVENNQRYQFVVFKIGDPLIATLRLMGISLIGTPMAKGNAPATPR